MKPHKDHPKNPTNLSQQATPILFFFELLDELLLDGVGEGGILPSDGLFAKKLIEATFGFEVVLLLRIETFLVETYHLRKLPEIKATLGEGLFGALLVGFELVLEDGDLAKAFPFVDEEAVLDTLGGLLRGGELGEFFFEGREAITEPLGVVFAQWVEGMLEMVLEAELEACELDASIGVVGKHRRDGSFLKAKGLKALG